MEDRESVEKLPSDLLEEIATFLPLESLCRFRAVSKNWNRFISHPDFASRHARASPAKEYVLISERDVDLEFSTGSWVVLDVASKRSFTLSADFLAEFVEQEEVPAPCPRSRLWSSNRRTILASDGGLLCLSYYVYHGGRIIFCELGTHETLLVCNPILKTVKQLPHFAGWSERPEWVVMSTDRDSMEYEIFFIHLPDDASQPNAVYIYKSKTASWRTSTQVPGHLNVLSGRHGSYSTSVVLKDEFYALFFDHDELLARLVSYNKLTGVLSDLGIDVPCGDTSDDHLPRLELVVSDGRLFCVIMTIDNVELCIQVSSIEIFEFILARREYIQLSELGSEMLDWFVMNDDYDLVYLNSKYGGLAVASAVATGLANSIFICSFSGRSMEYDLSNTTWQKYSDCNFYRLFLELFGSSIDLFGSNLCLSLCPP